MTASDVDVRVARDPTVAVGAETSIGDAVVGLARLAELALGRARMSLMQYRLMHHLRQGRSIQSDLAFQLAVTKQSVTRLVDGLVDRGYIRRKADDEDRRRVIHTITPKGQRALERADDLIEDYLMRVLQDLDDDTDIEVARHGIELFGRAKAASYTRVGPDGITPGRKRGRANA